jgi:hypothetical protein
MIAVAGDFDTPARFTTSGGAGNDPILARLADRLHLTALPQLLPSAFQPGTAKIDFGAWFLLVAMFSIAVWMLGQARPVEWIPAEPLGDLFPALWRQPAAATPDELDAEVVADGRRTPTTQPADAEQVEADPVEPEPLKAESQ